VAVGYRGGREVIRTAVETTGAPVALRVTPDRSAMAGDGDDVQPFTIDAVDAQGRHVPTANLAVDFDVTGGTIIGLGNGDPTSIEPEQGRRRSLFNGLAQVIVRADSGTGGLLLTASAAGLVRGSAKVRRLAAPARASVPPTRPVQAVTGWRQSPAFATKPDPGIAPADTDMNSWLWINPGDLQPAQGNGRWIAMIARVVPHRSVAARGGRIVLTNVTGRGELWVDGRRAAAKDSYAPGPLEGTLPPGDGQRRITVLIEADQGKLAGLSGAVVIRE
jgi:beta-galactosidase